MYFPIPNILDNITTADSLFWVGGGTGLCSPESGLSLLMLLLRRQSPCCYDRISILEYRRSLHLFSCTIHPKRCLQQALGVVRSHIEM